jgi:hypothetical protein
MEGNVQGFSRDTGSQGISTAKGCWHRRRVRRKPTYCIGGNYCAEHIQLTSIATLRRAIFPKWPGSPAYICLPALALISKDDADLYPPLSVPPNERSRRFAPSYCASFRAVKIDAAVSSTRFRPSSYTPTFVLYNEAAVNLEGDYGKSRERASAASRSAW